MSDVNYEESYLKCLQTFNNVLPKIREEIEAESLAYEKAKAPAEKGNHLAERTILIGKYIMLDQMLCFMFKELGLEVERDDIRSRIDPFDK